MARHYLVDDHAVSVLFWHEENPTVASNTSLDRSRRMWANSSVMKGKFRRRPTRSTRTASNKAGVGGECLAEQQQQQQRHSHSHASIASGRGG
ncbi:hypothetical protein QIS74_03383 [Colletotrichum tabaci]|uniref:Uncharacterized protein n=1 Tax=Colletotrichum tabaci TaxID=1209068 RepID=A0AAV9TR24_9PEZI